MKFFQFTICYKSGDGTNNMGYANAGFDTSTNNLLPIPGTNLYAYEGSNPIWLKKYDKIETKIDQSSGGFNSSAASTSSSDSNEGTTTTCCNGVAGNSKSRGKETGKRGNKSHADDISSFYLKQVDSPACTSRSSPNSSGMKNHSLTSTNSDILSLQNISPTFEMKNVNSENISTFKTDTLLTFASNQKDCHKTNSSNNTSSFNFDRFHPKNGNHQQLQHQFSPPPPSLFANQDNSNTTNSASSNINTNLTKIFDSYQQQVQQMDNSYIVLSHPTTAKDYCDLFAVESTVI